MRIVYGLLHASGVLLSGEPVLASSHCSDEHRRYVIRQLRLSTIENRKGNWKYADDGGKLAASSWHKFKEAFGGYSPCLKDDEEYGKFVKDAAYQWGIPDPSFKRWMVNLFSSTQRGLDNDIYANVVKMIDGRA